MQINPAPSVLFNFTSAKNIFLGVLFASLLSGWATTTGDCLALVRKMLKVLSQPSTSSGIETEASNFSNTNPTLTEDFIATAQSLIENQVHVIISSFNTLSSLKQFNNLKWHSSQVFPS